MDSYNAFINGLELVDIQLGELKCKKEIPFQECSKELKIQLLSNFTLKERLDKYMLIEANFKIEGFEKQDLGHKVFTIDVFFDLIYRTEDALTVSEEIIDKFVTVNVPLNAWPYGRELISTLTTRMGYPAVVIGTLKKNIG